ncbi:hypothetical protein LTR70_005806 [Exophiala xenobiotica]|uniref:Heterokaryon incompatibility domain-containing protein n=1 Tax=Lithohypha guttulata TaxID=1690604 RepID=A0ABR0K0N3_9EURO|nr:hypothetical protein LTR24_008199 [Lithohypha guttulata]KAK5317611.1 hypothetical protein LTR70_005806 [Exophiala xenobiotica]
MRLINTGSLALEEFSFRPPPPYAILSHTWQDEEVTYQDMSSSIQTSKQGWAKVVETYRLAAGHGLGYAWVDTCCIDKSSSAELTEAINSMFAWNQNASVCYVYLSDLPSGSQAEHNLPECRWWTRGWTLQELLAPQLLRFYDTNWVCIGENHGLQQIISKCAGIPEDVLRAGHSKRNTYSVAARMSWAARRVTTRLEDQAYCLLGLFDVNMPLIYGEGRRAFRRLQEEIVRRNNDLTIFAIDPRPNAQPNSNLFAETPLEFRNMGAVRCFPHYPVDFAITNRGLRFPGQVPLRLCAIRTDSSAAEIRSLVIFLGQLGEESNPHGMCLKKVGPRLLQKDEGFALLAAKSSRLGHVSHVLASDAYILLDTNPSQEALHNDYRVGAVHVPERPLFYLEDVMPESLWDFENRVFLKPRAAAWVRYGMVLAMRFHVKSLGVRVIVLCDYRLRLPKARILSSLGGRSSIGDLLFQQRLREDSMSWVDLEMYVPAAKELTISISITAFETNITISVASRLPPEPTHSIICCSP